MPASSTKINVPGVMVGWSWSNFASVSAGVPSSPPRTAAAAADGASATTAPPACRHASATTFIAVVFPAPAGAIPSCTTRPEQQNARTNPCCPGFNARPVAALWSMTRLDPVGLEAPSGAVAGRGHDPGLGVQDRGRGVEGGAVLDEHRLPVRPAQLDRLRHGPRHA